MTDTKAISEAINVQELFEKSKIDFSKEYIKNLQQSYDDGDLGLEELEDLIDSIKTVEKAFKKTCKNIWYHYRLCCFFSADMLYRYSRLGCCADFKG